MIAGILSERIDAVHDLASFDSDAAAFYAHHGFERLAGTNRLVMLTQAVSGAADRI